MFQAVRIQAAEKIPWVKAITHLAESVFTGYFGVNSNMLKNVRVSTNGDTPKTQDGFCEGKSESKIDDDLGVPP